jgi:hypothetical protein
MNVVQLSLNESIWEATLLRITIEPSLLLLFVSPLFKDKTELLKSLESQFPKATIIGCSTSGEISDNKVSDNTVSLTAIQFEKTKHKLVDVGIEHMDHSFDAGKTLATKLKAPNLKHVFVLSDGLNVNGADLVSGFKNSLPNISITGGLAGDGADFKKTFIIANNKMSDNRIVAVGFYGDHLKIGFSSKGGWDSFGKERLVTKSTKNVLFELDGHPALELYKSFLGKNATNLPSSGLLFPLNLRVNEFDQPVVRTILSVNENDQSLTFAGNIPEGGYVRLMKANIDRLIGGAEDSAKNAISNNIKPELAILISCVGRRLVLKQLVEEEVDAVKEIIGEHPKITGFYSYGEIAPFGEFSPCEFHNQTITITTFTEC